MNTKEIFIEKVCKKCESKDTCNKTKHDVVGCATLRIWRFLEEKQYRYG